MYLPRLGIHKDLQKLVHPKNKTPRRKHSNFIYAVQCQKKCHEFVFEETKEPLHKLMALHCSSGQDSAVQLHLRGVSKSHPCQVGKNIFKWRWWTVVIFNKFSCTQRFNLRDYDLDGWEPTQTSLKNSNSLIVMCLGLHYLVRKHSQKLCFHPFSVLIGSCST